MKSLRQWLADVTLGPACPHRCGYRARGWRTLAAHCDFDHAGDQVQTGVNDQGLDPLMAAGVDRQAKRLRARLADEAAVAEWLGDRS